MQNPAASPLAGKHVLVTDGEQRSALAVVRSLGLAGAQVIVGSRSGKSVGGASKYCRLEIRMVDPLTAPREFVRALRSTIDDQRVDMLIPITEASLRAVLSEFDGDSVVIPFPSAAIFANASDKRGVTELAAQLGVPVPRQMVLEARTDILSADPRLLGFPLILKPAASVAGDTESRTKLAVSHVDRPEAMQASLDAFPDEAFPLLVQERIVGPGVGVFLLRWEGQIIARFAHRRLREKPPAGGVSVYRESIRLPSDAVEFAERLLEALEWAGVAMVEFKQDSSSGIYYLMEINGRFWGSLQLAIDAGVDFPRLLGEAALGSMPERAVEGRPGIRLRWLLGDLDHLLLRLRQSRADLALGPDEPGRLWAVCRFLVPWRRGDRFEVLRCTDLRPFLREIKEWGGVLMDRR